jgi:hypothetical protein
VTTPAATGSSTASFTKIADDPRPHLLSVADVRGDQGGKVLLRWRASDFDRAPYRLITGYRVWRRAPLTDVASSARPPVPGGSRAAPPNAEVPDVFWENIAQLPAAYLEGYAYAAATLSDSSEAGNPFTAFFVQAVTSDPFVFFNSSPDSGYSVDNLAPPAPSPLTVRYGPSANDLHWRGTAIADLDGYELHRGASLGFVPTAANRVTITADTAFTDIAGGYYYKLAALDVHGNRSRYVAASPQVPVGTLASFVRFERRPGWLRLQWYSGGNTGMQAHVYRRSLDSDWASVGLVTTDGTGFLTFEDGSIEDPVRYAYRLGILGDGPDETFTQETWIDPLGAGALSLALGSNPSLGGRLRVALALTSGARADVSLFDLAGREVERHEASAGSDGRLELEFGASIKLRPGVYLVRAASGRVSLVRRVAILS